MSEDDQDGGERPKKSTSEAKSELFAALGHLRNAAELLVGAADPAVRKAATEAEKMLQKVGAEAEPMAQKLGAELGKMAGTIVGAIEGAGKGRKSEPPPAESEVERLERLAAEDADDDETR